MKVSVTIRQEQGTSEAVHMSIQEVNDQDLYAITQAILAAGESLRAHDGTVTSIHAFVQKGR
jgi:hypothetical protein